MVEAATAVAVNTLVEAAVNTLVGVSVVAVLTLAERNLLTPAKRMSEAGRALAYRTAGSVTSVANMLAHWAPLGHWADGRLGTNGVILTGGAGGARDGAVGRDQYSGLSFSVTY